MPPPKTPGHSQASLGPSLVGSLLLSPGSWCAQGSVRALLEPISQSWVNSNSSMVGLMAPSFKKAYAIPGLPHPEPLRQATADPYPCRRHSDTVLAQSLGAGSVFLQFPGLRSSGDRCLVSALSQWAMHLNHLPGPGCLISQMHHESTVSVVLYVSSGELISDCDPPGGCQPSRTSR